MSNTQHRRVDGPRRTGTLILATLICVAVITAISRTLLGAATAGPSPNEVRATAESVQFATAQTVRQATRQSARATSEVAAEATGTAEASSRQRQVVSRAATSTAQTQLTAKAPATQAAKAAAYETRREEAAATTQVLSSQATPLYVASSGTLTQRVGGQAICNVTPFSLHNFIAEASFHNPDPGQNTGATSHAWDYGITFQNIAEENEYQLMIGSDGEWTLALRGTGLDVINSIDNGAINTVPGGVNNLKLFVTRDTIIVYINDRYIDGPDLSMFGIGHAHTSAHQIALCAGTRQEEALAGRQIRYENFQLSSLP